MLLRKSIVLLIALTPLASYSVVVSGTPIDIQITTSNLNSKHSHRDSQILGSEYFHGPQGDHTDDPNANDRVRLWLKKNSDTEEVVTRIRV